MNNSTKIIKFTAITPVTSATDSTTYWASGRSTGKRDIMLDNPLPLLSATDIAAIPPADIAALLNKLAASYIRTVSLQKLEVGNSLEMEFPTAGAELAKTYLGFAMGTRSAQALTPTRLKALLDCAFFRAVAMEYISINGIKSDAFNKICINDILMKASRKDLSFVEHMTAKLKRSIEHFSNILEMLQGLYHGASDEESALFADTINTLSAAIKALQDARILSASDDLGI